MAWPGLYNLLHGFLLGPGILGRTASGAGPAALLSGSDVVTMMPAATSSADGKMTATQAAAVARLRGVGTTTQRDAIANPQAGDTWHNTDYLCRLEVYNGTFWLAGGHRVVTLQTGETSKEGAVVRVVRSASYNYAVEYPSSADPRVHGVIVTGGIANGGQVVIAVKGLAKILMLAGDETEPGWWIKSSTNGRSVSVDSPSEGCYAMTLENVNNYGADFLALAEIGLNTEIY